MDAWSKHQLLEDMNDLDFAIITWEALLALMFISLLKIPVILEHLHCDAALYSY